MTTLQTPRHPQPAPSLERSAPSAGALRCPACQDRDLEMFYTLAAVPSHSCVLMPTREEAVSFPRGDLELTFCRGCGFIFNAAYDESLRQYSERYEETQGFSPTFNAFARELAHRYVERYGLGHKTSLEIGCGKGEFLVLLCELSGGSGIGLDPSYIPARTSSPAAARIRFIRDYYGPKYAHLRADFIVCRHTLEHIAPVGQFMRDLRQTIADSNDSGRGTALFFELPDVARVLDEGAFWDLYYEHCTYFTTGSLARLFRAAEFDVTHLSLEYGGQYIILDAVPADGPTLARLELEDDLDRTCRLVENFRDRCGATIQKWRKVIDAARQPGSRTVVWGSGSKGVAFLTTLGVTDEIEYVVDINPHKHGKFMPGTGQRIVPPEFLRDYRPDRVIVMNPVYTREIGESLRNLGVDSELLPV